MGWYCANSAVTYAGCYDTSDWGGPHPVALKQANSWNFFDMHGNVWEWIHDWYGTYPESQQAILPGRYINPDMAIGGHMS